MKRLLLTIIILLFAFPVFATDYYAGKAGGNINDDDVWFTTSTGSCTGSTGVTGATALQAGNTLYANGCSLTVNVSFTATKITNAAGSGTVGGSFAVATSTSPLTITSAIENGATADDCLVITGSANANPALTIVGNITGGSTANGYAISDSHTVGTVVITGAVTGGSNSSAFGIAWSGSSGTVAITGNVTANTGNGFYSTAAGSSTVTGDCIAATVEGCYTSGSGYLTVVGNLQNSQTAVAAKGRIIWTPGATNYMKVLSASTPTYQYYGKPPAASNVETDDYIINLSDGVQTQGTATGGGGGGAWAY